MGGPDATLLAANSSHGNPHAAITLRGSAVALIIPFMMEGGTAGYARMRHRPWCCPAVSTRRRKHCLA